jgi:hypothetical protein
MNLFIFYIQQQELKIKKQKNNLVMGTSDYIFIHAY